MSKAVLFSIKPKYCELIASGKKTIEVRKTKPKLDTPFKCYIYCTHNGSSAKEKDRNLYTDFSGKVIGEFMCKCINEWHVDPQTKGYFITSEELTATCLTYEQLHEYGNGKTLYGWHISNLVIYDKPRKLREFIRICPEWEKEETTEKCLECEHLYRSPIEPFIECDYEGELPITRPPQSWCYVEELK